MAVVINASNKDKFIDLARQENLEATHVATVTDTGYMRMFWNGKVIVNMSREFIDTNGVKQTTKVHVDKVNEENTFFGSKVEERECELALDANIKDKFIEVMSDLNVCSKKD